MGKKIIFNHLSKKDYFNMDMEMSNELDFSNETGKKVIVLYGPNGIGKSTFCSILSKDPETELKISIDGIEYNRENLNCFHVIKDQNLRNIIQGETEEFFLGDNIAKERKLKLQCESELQKIVIDIKDRIKEKYNFKYKKTKFFEKIKNQNLKVFLKDMIFSKNILQIKDIGKLLNFYQEISEININSEYDSEKYKYFINDISKDENSIIIKLVDFLENRIPKAQNVRVIDENTNALRILNLFSYKSDCIVCDTPNIDVSKLIAKKETQKRRLLEDLDEDVKKAMEEIIEKIEDEDPFYIKNKLVSLLENDKINSSILIDEFTPFFDLMEAEINNLCIEIFKTVNLKNDYEKYIQMLNEKLEISVEDERFIQQVISNNIYNKKIELKRDEENNIKIFINNENLIGADRTVLPLSTGEQNFISMAFELLRASKVNEKTIVIDDPISSYDSIFKNKIIFCILKILEEKNVIILTHNTETVRLLEHQKKNCFDLYLIKNYEDDKCFMKINKEEQDFLIYMDKINEFFRKDFFKEIGDYKNFLVAIIPFMRGYANFVGESGIYKQLSKVMHGYEKENVCISEIYEKLFVKDNSDEVLEQYSSSSWKYEVNVDEILSINIDEIKILKKGTKYVLLDSTLKSTLIYLYLRLKTEKILVKTYNIPIKDNLLLSHIINEAFKGEANMDAKIFFNCKKTLINEFNHYEGNMNIFQPAIDISQRDLNNEKKEILNKLKEIEEGEKA